MEISSSLNQARRLIQKGKRKQARSLLREIAKSYPKNEEVYILFAQVAEKREHAIVSLQQALKINPDNTTAQDLLINLISSFTKSSGKKTDFRRVL